MKSWLKVLAWFAVFTLVFIWRLPCETLLSRIMESTQSHTGIAISWREMEMGLTGVHLEGLDVALPSGSRFSADKAFIGYSLSGLHIEFTQYDSGKILAAARSQSAPSGEPRPGQASFQIGASQIDFKSDNLAIDTGSRDLGAIQLGGRLQYDYRRSVGKGVLNLKLPSLKGSLPIELYNIELGSTLTIEPTPRSSQDAAGARPLRITNRLKLFNENVTGEGQVILTTSPSGHSPSLEGDLTFNAKAFGVHKVHLSGTWANPEWNLAGAK